MPLLGGRALDAFARLAASLLEAPSAFVVATEGDGAQTVIGAYGPDADGTSERDFCAQVLREGAVVVETRRLRVGAPVRASGAMRAALVVVAPWSREPRAEEIELLEILADQIGERIAGQALAEECAAAREAANRLAVVFEGIAEGIVLHDRDGTIVSVNPAAERILGTTLAELSAPGAPPLDLVHEDGLPLPQASLPFEKTRASGEPLSDVVLGLRRADREIAWLAVNSRPMRGEHDAKPYAVVITFHDITALKAGQAAAERLARQEHLVTTGTLAAGVGHEINNPLAAILANLELAIDQVRDISGGSPAGRLRDLVHVLAESRDGVDRIRTIVRGLRGLAREGAPPSSTDIESALRTALGMAAHETRRRATVTTDLAGVPPVLADESRLTQVLVNLVVNAAQAFEASDADANRIAVRTKLEKDRVVVEVEDNGPGIEPEMQRRIFDPFFTTKSVGQGTGLGLSISRSVVTALGGELTVTSRVGAGSTFRVALLPAASAYRQRTEPPPRANDVPGVRGRILLVDDEPTVLGALKRCLEREHDVVAFRDPREAAASIDRGETFDVVFCDLMMPSLNGNDLWALARAKDPALADRFVFITGGATQPRLRDFLDEVVNERIEKPFSIQNIRGVARRFVAARRP